MINITLDQAVNFMGVLRNGYILCIDLMLQGLGYTEEDRKNFIVTNEPAIKEFCGVTFDNSCLVLGLDLEIEEGNKND